MSFEAEKLKVKANLTESRYLHTLRVCETAKELAQRYHADVYAVQQAALFHDYAKCMKESDLEAEINRRQLDPSLFKYHHELWHGPVGAEIVKEQFGVINPDALNAIRYHTTGRCGMSLTEQVLFVSDYIEPARNFPGLDEVRSAALVNLTQAAYYVARNSMLYLIENEAMIHPDGVAAYNDLKNKYYGGV